MGGWVRIYSGLFTVLFQLFSRIISFKIVSSRTRFCMDYTYTSVVLSACCFLVVITSDLLRSHRKKVIFQSVSGQSQSAICKACKNHVATTQASSLSLACAVWNENRNWNNTGIFSQLPGR